MGEERLGGAVGDRPAGRPPPAAHPDPARLQQQVERALAGGDAPDLLDLGAGHRLVVGDDRERLQRRPRQPLLLDRIAAEQERKIARGAERPFAGDLDEVDAARRRSSAADRGAARRRRCPPAAARQGRRPKAARPRRTAAPRPCAGPGGAPPATGRRRLASLSTAMTTAALELAIAGLRVWLRATADAVADVERREGFGLAEIDLALAHQFEARAEGARRHAARACRADEIGRQEDRPAASTRRCGRSCG